MQVKDYYDILNDLKEKISGAREQAVIAVNTQLLSTYWEIGNAILLQQKKQGWGAKIIQQLSNDLRTSFPDMKGLSVRNMYYMRAFAEAWPTFQIVQPSVAELQQNENESTKFLQALVAQIPWTHH